CASSSAALLASLSRARTYRYASRCGRKPPRPAWSRRTRRRRSSCASLRGSLSRSPVERRRELRDVARQYFAQRVVLEKQVVAERRPDMNADESDQGVAQPFVDRYEELKQRLALGDEIGELEPAEE